jgi:hypothetical protein
MRVVLFIIIVFVSLTSCRSTRKITTIIPQKDSAIVVINPAETDSAISVRATFDSIQRKRINFTSFSAKLKVEYRDDIKGNFDFNAFLKMKKDSAIWISCSFVFGVEAIRVIITPDSVTIMNKLKNTVERKSLSYLQAITQVPFDYATLEDLIIGNPVYLDRRIISYTDQGEKISLATLGNSFKHFLTVGKNDLQLLFSKLDDVDLTRSRTANLAYAGYLPVGPWMFSNTRNISLSEKNKLDILLEFKQVDFDKPVAFPFNIPKNYRIIN